MHAAVNRLVEELRRDIRFERLRLGFAIHEVQSEQVSGEEALTVAEASIYRSFSVEKRRRDWRAGRLAAKAAVQRACESAGRVGHAAGQIEVLAGLGGAPRAAASGAELAQVSITHSGKVAVAVASVGRAAGGLGIDLEQVLDSPPWEAAPLVFTAPELARIRAVPSRFWDFWVAKEAVLKALGVGFRSDPRSLQVEDGCNEVALACAGGGIRLLPVKVVRERSCVLALSWL